MTVEVEIVEPVIITEESNATAEAQAAYDKVANRGNTQEEPKQAVEIPPANTELLELRAQVNRIPDVLKQLNDVNGRYGRLTQRFEEMQKQLATPVKTQDAAVADEVDIEELMKEVKEVFGDDEMYQSLKSAFAKSMAGRGRIDPESIGKLVTERIAAEREAEFASNLEQITKRHEDFFTVKETPEFELWLKTLSARERASFLRSIDPDYVGDMIDEFKEWKSSEATRQKEPNKQSTPPKSKARLEAAVLPTNGASVPLKATPSDIEQMRAAYNRIAGKRL